MKDFLIAKDFQQQLYNLINNSDLNIILIYFILKTVIYEIENELNKDIIDQSISNQNSKSFFTTEDTTEVTGQE